MSQRQPRLLHDIHARTLESAAIVRLSQACPTYALALKGQFEYPAARDDDKGDEDHRIQIRTIGLYPLHPSRTRRETVSREP